jgi:hypothetical protein
MLRLALDAAEGAKAAETSAAGGGGTEAKISDNENTSLAQESTLSRGVYGSIASKNQEEEIESQEYDDDDINSDDGDDDSSSEPSEEEKEPFLERCCLDIRDCIATIADVDNLWDESAGHITRRNRLLVLFWFFMLATAYAGERSTFYLLCDRTGPFRLFSAVMITSCHALLLAFGMLLSAIHRRDFSPKSLGIPIVDAGCT